MQLTMPILLKHIERTAAQSKEGLRRLKNRHPRNVAKSWRPAKQKQLQQKVGK